MDVYIKGMGMPENCMHCWFGFSMNFLVLCTPTQTYTPEEKLTGRPQYCPLLSLPEKHGRLIDADELKTAFPCGESVRTECVRATIDYAPTVIPASEEGET